MCGFFLSRRLLYYYKVLRNELFLIKLYITYDESTENEFKLALELLDYLNDDTTSVV
jgi:hypothetical protein